VDTHEFLVGVALEERVDLDLVNGGCDRVVFDKSTSRSG
jgi:hypothetical protein